MNVLDRGQRLESVVERPGQRLLYRGLAATDLVESLLRPRALLARAHCDEAAYRDFVEPYRVMATSPGFEGHMSTTDAMT